MRSDGRFPILAPTLTLVRRWAHSKEPKHGAFTLYLPILKLLEPHLKTGAIIIGENAFAQAGGYIEHVRDHQNGYLSLPLSFDPGRGNELTVKTT